MKYVVPEDKTKNQIKNGLGDPKLSENEIKDIILSAIYGHEPTFAIDILIAQFRIADDKLKGSLSVLFDTAHSMHKTDYRISESICVLQQILHSDASIGEIIEDLEWSQKKFSQI